MKYIESEKKAKIFILGCFISIIVLLMAWVVLARAINDLIVDLFSKNNVLLLIIILLELFSLGLAIGVGLLLTEDVSRKTVLKASLMAFVLSFVLIIGISYFVLGIIYPEVFSELKGIDFITNFPAVIMYFSIYILNHPFMIYIITIFLYYLFFVIFLETYYEFENRYSYEDLIRDMQSRRFL